MEAIRKVEEKIGVLAKEHSPMVITQNWMNHHFLARMTIVCFKTHQGHLDQAIWIFSYLKRHKHLATQIDSRPPLIDHGSVHSCGEPDFSSLYPDVTEDIDGKLLEALGPGPELP
jgi:hypothetical protein